MKKIIKPDIRNFVNITAHPAGCEQNVREQVEHSIAACPGTGINNVLVVGSSAGYGLSSLITAVFGYGAKGLGVCFEKPVKNRRSATPGSYNVAALHKIAREKGKTIETINSDAFSDAARQEVVAALKARFGKLDYLIYSLASSRRTDPATGYLYNSCLKPIGTTFSTQTINIESNTLQKLTIEPAVQAEIDETVKVMGGEDWQLWVKALSEADLLNPGCRIIAYTYIGSEITAPIYRSGTIGAAKKHLEATTREINRYLAEKNQGKSWVCACQAIVTRASVVIPAMPLYLSLLKKGMGNQYESTIEQITRLFKAHFAPGIQPTADNTECIRLDDRELLPAVQQYVKESWAKITEANWQQLADWDSFKEDFIRTAGFGIPGVDYNAEYDSDVNW